MKRIVVEVSGGVLTAIYCDEDDIEVLVIDWDDIRETESPENPVCTLDVYPLFAMPIDTRYHYERAVAHRDP